MLKLKGERLSLWRRVVLKIKGEDVVELYLDRDEDGDVCVFAKKGDKCEKVVGFSPDGHLYRFDYRLSDLGFVLNEAGEVSTFSEHSAET